MSVNDNSSFNWTTTTILPSRTIGNIKYREQVLIDAFNTYIQISIGSLLFLFGVTFNCLSLLYFCVSRSFRHTTFRLYFSIIAILDTIRLFEFLVFLLFDRGYLKVTVTLCRLVFFTIMFTGQASIWLTVALAVEKCIIIWFPIKGRLCFTMFISKTVLVFVLCLVFFANVLYLLPSFFTHTYEKKSIHTFMCVWHNGNQSSINSYDQKKKHYLTFNTVFFHSIIPSIILLIINWLILYSLSRQRTILSKIGSIDAKNVLKREKQFKEKTIQLVLSSFFVIITISPRYILTMVNAFGTSVSTQPLMPLYIYVNLNTVFRVLEMCNYSLNIIFAILSGRTSRLEIRKLLWECLFWRFKRTQTGQKEGQYRVSSFLFSDDDDDTDRSIQVQNSSPYHALTVKSSNRPSNLSPRISSGNYSSQQSQNSTATTVFNCCGISIDLSHKQPHKSTSKNQFDDSSSHRSLANKNSNPMLSKTLSNSQSPQVSSNARLLRPQNTVCYRSDSTHRPITRRRATLVHCSHRTPTSINTTITSSLLPSSANQKQCLTFKKLSPIIDIPVTTKDPCKININLIEPPIITQPDCNDMLLPAYVIETC